MSEFRFDALGTGWSITIDDSQGQKVDPHIWPEIIARTEAFDQQFSRFIEGSEVTSFRHSPAGTYSISPELTQILQVADQLRTLTNGAYDPAIGTLLEATGYDGKYRFTPDIKGINHWQLPHWLLNSREQTISIDRGVVFDIGGMGKGYWIDQLSQYLLTQGYPHHIVDGGGDMMATSKADGKGWRVALEWPGQPERALGVVELHHQGLAVSDTFRRRWGDWHHLLNVKEKTTINDLLGCIALADNAWLADQLTSVLSLVKPNQYQQLAHTLEGTYVVLLANGTAHISPHWSGKLF